jgi:glycosyltransferase involved in cell wall biosynthesis
VVLQMAEALDNPVVVTASYAPERTFPGFMSLPVHALDGAAVGAGPDVPEPGLSSNALRSLDLAGADLVVISSTGLAHHVAHPRSVVYWHHLPETPGMHPGDHPHSDTGADLPRTATAPLRRQDVEAALMHRRHLANSQHTADQLRARYGIDAGVLYPSIDTTWLGSSLTDASWPPRALVVSRLVPANRVDVAIAACREIGIPLTVIGEGPDLRRLHQMADRSVTFISSVSDAALATAYRAHAVVVCPGNEHFGLVPLEAGYVGRPVVASSAGAAMESVLHRETGWLVGGWDPIDWAKALTQVLQRRWDPVLLRAAVQRFGSTASFEQGFGAWLSGVVDPEQALRAPMEPAFDLDMERLLAS